MVDAAALFVEIEHAALRALIATPEPGWRRLRIAVTPQERALLAPIMDGNRTIGGVRLVVTDPAED